MRKKSCTHAKIHEGYGLAFGGIGPYHACDFCGLLMWKRSRLDEDDEPQIYVRPGYDPESRIFSR